MSYFDRAAVVAHSLHTIRSIGMAVAALLLTLAPASAVLAQNASPAPITIMVKPGQDVSDLDAAIRAAEQAGRSVILQVEAQQPTSSPTTTAPAPTQTASDPTVAMDSMWMFSDLVLSFQLGMQRAIAGFRGLPAAFQSSWQILSAEAEGPSRAGLAALVSALAGLAAAYVVRMALTRLSLRIKPKHAFSVAVLRLAFDAIAILSFITTAYLVLHQMAIPRTFTRQVAGSFLAILTGGLVYAAAGRFLFKSNGDDKPPLLDIARPYWHFRMLLAYGVLNAFIANSVRLADVRMVEATAADSWLFLTVSVLTILKLWWFIAGRQDIATAFAGRESGHIRRFVGNVLADFYIVSAVLIWLAGLLVAGTSQNTVWAKAAGTTQFLMIMIPVLDRGIVTLLATLAKKREEQQGRDFIGIVLRSLGTPLAGAVWLIGLHIVVQLWQPLMMGASTLVTTWLIWLERLSFALIVSWTICSFLLRYFDAVAPTNAPIIPGQEDEAKVETSRISTILPVVRNLILGAVVAIAGLVIISTAGVDVAPLLAGFGVLGLALSFGSQTLVKDVVSGIFFLAEDAFRIGEYINTGKLVGTVEQISLRSIRLRHHNGPIHTIPFGQISSVTNYSRDWGTIKFELRFDRDADLEMIRKTAKKVGIGLLDHPEFGDYFLVPVKMQGIHDVNETSMVIRFKFTARPGKPTLIKREAMKRLLAAFKEAGLPLASNAVVVRSGSGQMLESGGAAATVIPLPANQM
ncbi:mechanosensitive ion channel family protein [Affinirhizobium pseudoryzae]|uniref:mechanosensitive ion channel family protein n=1 Tax=Allorhizobium pseudoryzae TaxID=379684 RepID=UPI0013ED7426|nr:mechanosensitive ion channel family protein [Allorhizobium pseudoryzae]